MNRWAFVVPAAAVLVAGAWGWKSGELRGVPENAADSRTVEELKALENEADQAMLRGDMEAIDRIFSDDWIIVDDEAEVRDKKTEFEPYKTGEAKVIAERIDDIKVRLYGDAAVLTGRFMFKGSFQGKPFGINGRFTDVFVKQKGHWHIVSSHNSSFPKGPTS